MKLSLILAGCLVIAGIIGAGAILFFKIEPVKLFTGVILTFCGLAAFAVIIWGFFQYRSTKKAKRQRMLTSGMC